MEPGGSHGNSSIVNSRRTVNEFIDFNERRQNLERYLQISHNVIMETSNTAPQGMVVTPHHLATQSALAILREGGTAMEATVAAAATLAVVYPHMNSIGGDGFWLIVPPNGDPVVIEACGVAGSTANLEFFKGFHEIPLKGPKSGITVAGTVGGWQNALDYVSECGLRRVSVSRLLADAIAYAEYGFPVASSHEKYLKCYISQQKVSEDFKKIYLPDGRLPQVGDLFYQKALATTLRNLAKDGLNSFYCGKLAKSITEDMASFGMPITESDLANFSPTRKTPLKMTHKYGDIYNTPPPTQGLVSLAILGILDHLNTDGKHEGEFIHTAVEATKQAFNLRDQHITDPDYMMSEPQSLISKLAINKMAQNINFDQASSEGRGQGSGDTIWMGVMDNKGFSVSFIQSVYHVFGSGVVLPNTGILWHNRGVSFSLDEEQLLSLKPGKKPFHTLNPAAAKLSDGRVIVYGTRGGDGQPQTQAAIFHRYVVQGLPLQKSVSDPRWLYGLAYGEPDDKLKLEDRFSEETVTYLKEKGHAIVIVEAYSEEMGHAGALVRHPKGTMEGAFDPRSNGSAAGF